MHCIELIYKYYVSNIVENLDYKGTPLAPPPDPTVAVSFAEQPGRGRGVVTDVEMTETTTVRQSFVREGTRGGRGCRMAFYGAVPQDDVEAGTRLSTGSGHLPRSITYD